MILMKLIYNNFKQKLTQLTKELDKPSNISIQQDSTSFINKISVVVSSRKFVYHIYFHVRFNLEKIIISLLAGYSFLNDMKSVIIQLL